MCLPLTSTRRPSQHWLSQMAFVRRIVAGQITNVDTPDVLLGDFNHDRCVAGVKWSGLGVTACTASRCRLTSTMTIRRDKPHLTKPTRSQLAAAIPGQTPQMNRQRSDWWDPTYIIPCVSHAYTGPHIRPQTPSVFKERSCFNRRL